MRVDQLYLSVIFFRYFYDTCRTYYSFQLLNSPYFEYYYHNSNISHCDDYKPDLLKIEMRDVYYQKVVCKYFL